jgi:hypothetical protein
MSEVVDAEIIEETPVEEQELSPEVQSLVDEFNKVFELNKDLIIERAQQGAMTVLVSPHTNAVFIIQVNEEGKLNYSVHRSDLFTIGKTGKVTKGKKSTQKGPTNTNEEVVGQ